jgi:hypothetical protein
MPDPVQDITKFLEENKYVTPALVLFLILYAALIAPNLSERTARLFDNSLFNLLVFFLIAYSARINPTVAVIAAIGVMVSLITLNNYKVNKKLTAAITAAEVPKTTTPTLTPIMTPSVEGMRTQARLAHAPSPHVEDEHARGTHVPPAALTELKADHGASLKDADKEGCVKRADFRNSFYPQYVNMDPFAYEARFSDGSVAAFDPTAAHASI